MADGAVRATSSSAAAPVAPEETPLRRAIGGRLLFLFALGDMLGGGIYS